MEEAYAERYRVLYERHWWWRARERLVLDALRRRPPARPGAVLDVGCGDGLMFDRLADFGPVEGVEPDAHALTDDGPWRDRIHRVPFDRSFAPGRRYAIIVMLDVLEHLDDPVDALAHAVDLLEPGGRLLVTVPAFRLLWTTHDELNHHRTRYRRPVLQAEAAAAGMRVDHCRYFFHFLFPLKVAVRAKEALVPTRPAVPRVPPPPLNGVLGLIARAEQAVPVALAPPFGSSLLAIGGRAEG